MDQEELEWYKRSVIKKFNRAVKLTTRAKLALASSMDYHAAFPERLTFLRLLLKDV